MKKTLYTITLFLLSVGVVQGADTLYEYYDGNLPSITERAKIYQGEGYTGTAEQNIKLLQQLQPTFILGAQPALTTFQGGTGSTSPSGILYGDSTIRLKTLNIGSGLNFASGILSSTIGGSKWATSTNDSTAIYSASATKVGIGTSTPAYALQVNGAINAISNVARGTSVGFSGSDASASAAHPRAYFYGYSGSAITNFGLYSSSGQNSYIPAFFGVSTHPNVKDGGSKQAMLAVGTGGTSGLLTLTAEADGGAISDLFLGGSTLAGTNAPVWIKSTGLVGIGTSAPASLLHLQSTNVTGVPRGDLAMARYWASDTDTRASSLFHYYNAEDMLAFGVSGDGGSNNKPNQLSQIKMNLSATGKLGIGLGAIAPTTVITIGSTTDQTVRSLGTKIAMEQTGDPNGTTRLSIVNFTGANGAQFENDGLDVVDFRFIPSSLVPMNIRYEHRSASLIGPGNTTGEFQFGLAGSPQLYTGASASGIVLGNFGIGTTSPYARLSVVGSSGVVADKYHATNTLATSTFNGNIQVDGTTRLNTSLAGLLKSVGGYIYNAVADVDYQVPLTFGDGLTRTVDDIDCDTASASVFGCLSSTDWSTFNDKQNAISVTWPITLSGATVGFNGLSTSSPAVIGNIPYFSGVNTFDNVATGTVSSSGGITTTAGRSVLGGALAITCDVASSLIPGCLSAADWTTFNNKVSTSRQLTVAGTANQISSSAGAQDLSADRTWTLSLPNHVIFPGSFLASTATITNATTTNLTVSGVADFLGDTVDYYSGDEINQIAATNASVSYPAVGVIRVTNSSVPAAWAGQWSVRLPQQLHGKKATLRDITFYYSGVGANDYITSNLWYEYNPTDASNTNPDNDTTDITAGTSHVMSGVPVTLGIDESDTVIIVRLNLQYAVSGGQTIDINGLKVTWDTQ